MGTTLIGYARCSTGKQELAAQKAALEKLGVAADRIYTDHGLTGTNRFRPGLDQALAAIRTGDGQSVGAECADAGAVSAWPANVVAGGRGASDSQAEEEDRPVLPPMPGPS